MNMPPKVTLEEVADACQALLRASERPTAQRIQEFLGKGTTIGIGKLLKALQNESAGQTDTQLNLTEVTDEEITPMAIAPEHPTETPPIVPAKQSPMTLIPTPMATREFKIEPKEKSVSTTDFAALPAREEKLDELSETELIIRIRRLESMLIKENSRREAAEKMAEQAKDYADTIKEQVALRINDLRETMATLIEQLKAEAKIQKDNADRDLLFYREQLKASNHKLLGELERSTHALT